ncbi:MAG: hypothetical protein JRJ15_02075 [Deltaproteobacteria bacterium]|nr:hypothetical protein [Deltaproteobacteria bacterium]
MILRVKHKGSRIQLDKDELREYMQKGFHEINVWASGVVTALVVVTFVCIFFLINAKMFYYYLLLIFPILGRYLFGTLILNWLSKLFKELVEI